MVWGPTDIDSHRRTVEVTSVVCSQSWDQARPSSIRFKIGTRCHWIEETGLHEDTACWHTDCSAFSPVAEQVHRRVDPLYLVRWEFYVLFRSTGTVGNLLDLIRTPTTARPRHQPAMSS